MFGTNQDWYPYYIYILYKNYHWNVWILTKIPMTVLVLPGQILRVRTASGSRLAVPKFDNWTPRSARDERLDSFN